MARDDAVEPQVRKKCKVLFVQWANNYKGKPGLERIANLYKEFPKTQRPAAAREKVLKETDPFQSPDDTSMAEPSREAEQRARAPSTSQKPSQTGQPSRPITLTPTSSGFPSKLFKDKKSAGKGFSLSREKDNMTNAIAQASIASTNLLNGLQLINRETERVSENKEVIRRFEACKTLRRQILYYIQHVESDDWIGSLVNANDDLVNALTSYEIMDRSISEDSDSDAWEDSGSVPNSKAHARKASAQVAEQQLAGLSLNANSPPAKPPRPAPAPASIPMPPPPSFASSSARVQEDEDDEDDPFGDSNAVPTPRMERPGMTWREV